MMRPPPRSTLFPFPTLFRSVRDVLSVMHTCGMYDFAGQWAYRVGIPAKSGVSGGVMAVVPGKLGIAIFSPGLDAYGNSVRGTDRKSTRLNSSHANISYAVFC